MNDSQLSAQLAVGFDELPIADQVPVIRWFGGTGVQVWPRFSRPMDWLAVRREVEDAGLAVRSLHAAFGNGVDISTPVEADRRTAVAVLTRTLDALVTLGGGFLVVHPSNMDAGKMRKKERMARRPLVAECLAALVPEAAARNVRIAVENMPPDEVGSTGEELVDIVTRVNDPHVGVCFDTGHANLVGRFERQWRAVQPHVFTLHVHDNDGKTDTHVEPFSGTIDWRAFRRSLGSINYGGDFSLECLEAVVSLYRRLQDGWRDVFRKWWGESWNAE